MDLKEATAATEPLFEGPDARGPTLLPIRRSMRTVPPVLVAVNGLCITGGMELILCCDIVFAATTRGSPTPTSGSGCCPGGGSPRALPGRSVRSGPKSLPVSELRQRHTGRRDRTR